MTSKPILITMGDPSGIGPEIIAQAFAQGQAPGCVVVGDAKRIAEAGKPWGVQTLGLSPEPASLALAQEHMKRCDGHPVIPVLQATTLADKLAWGVVSAEAGLAAYQCILAALQLRDAAHAIVTAPIHKAALHAAGIDFPGHTEILQHAAGGVPVRMMLANQELRVVLVTVHLSLRKAIDLLSTELIATTIQITDTALRKTIGRAPRIAVAGLNPHAGESGLFGDEEARIIAPAIAQAQQGGAQVSGPFAPDSVFMRARQGEFDVVIAMYHDQGLIPVKYLGVAHGVNVTLGLPFLRTSPDHGTAFDIAGLGTADPSSLIAAIEYARQHGALALAPTSTHNSPA